MNNPEKNRKKVGVFPGDIDKTWTRRGHLDSLSRRNFSFLCQLALTDFVAFPTLRGDLIL
jgi:hypothetical protein